MDFTVPENMEYEIAMPERFSVGRITKRPVIRNEPDIHTNNNIFVIPGLTRDPMSSPNVGDCGSRPQWRGC